MGAALAGEAPCRRLSNGEALDLLLRLQPPCRSGRRRDGERPSGWPGFAASLATKVLHKKRPELIPVLDNQAIFAYMSATWPRQMASTESVKDGGRILQALDCITVDLNRHENLSFWPMLQEIEPTRTLIQLFDSVWWMYFRLKQPVPTRTP
ncbi:MAG TPA: DUF6308 family protein [Anaerolineae bacterium]|nr:DUF6308 family protein [Anaerolineae bacterium]